MKKNLEYIKDKKTTKEIFHTLAVKESPTFGISTDTVTQTCCCHAHASKEQIQQFKMYSV